MYPRTGKFLVLMRHRVGDHQTAELAPVDRLDGLPAQDTVSDDGDDLLGAMTNHCIGGIRERAARVGHVVNQYGNLVLDVSHEDHARHFIGPRPLLVNEGEA